MNTDKKGFFLKLNPPRSSFTHDMTAQERSIMQQHLAYWDTYVNDGTVIALGPVFDPKGGFGIGIIGLTARSNLKIY
jgi:uncharacterized protein